MPESSNHREAAEKLRQLKQRAVSLRNGDGPWTVVCDDWHHSDGDNGGRFAAFAQPSLRNKVLSDASWDLTKGQGGPGFSQYPEDGEWVTTYHRNTEGPDIEPLIIVQEFHGVVPDAYMISEEFRLLMGLWQDPASGHYYSINEDGSTDLAIQSDGAQIKVRTPILRRYQAARQLDLLLFTDSVTFAQTEEHAQAFEDLEERDHVEEELNFISLSLGDTGMRGRRISSRMLVKRVLPPPPREKSGIWPWDRNNEDFPEFIISEDVNGGPVRYSCDPEQLANYFGKNPSAPHYLTPVFFKPDVLQRYYGDPALYSISDGYLSCGNLWGVRIDNGNPELVMVFLGDLGRDVPAGHRAHWLAYNTPPVASMSESNFRRSFLAQFADTDNPEHLFKHAYNNLQDTWFETWGWRLHRQLTGADAQVIQRLRIPLNESDTEFMAQLLDLAKLLVDCLNETDIARSLPKVDGEKGIGKLERFLREVGYREVDRDIALLRRIQSLRSRVAAHTSGSTGQAYLAAELEGQSRRALIIDLMRLATSMFADLASLRPTTVGHAGTG